MNGFQKTSIIKGVAFFADKIDGQDINVGSIFIEEELDTSKGNAKGFRTVEYRADSADVVKPLMHLEFPITGEVHFRMQVTKRNHQIIVEAVKPISLAKGQPQVQPAGKGA
ncbi:MAG: hypothetical protein EPO12_17840 [Aquabacterium sp.]|nr:MAG: hypothetical protein EPO12_17840 [Aquabacterium sp.]